MKYNEKYGRYFTKVGLVFRYDTKQDKLVLCKQRDSKGYKYYRDTKRNMFRVHRAIYETFVGEIPDGYEIDHINGEKADNRLTNLRAVTKKENMNNPLTIQKISEFKRNKPQTNSEFGKKYFEHFGYSNHENPKQYDKEIKWFKRHGKCSWE